MGNFSSTRRSSSVSGSISTISWEGTNIDRLILERKLAPKALAAESSVDSKECPICFLDYAALNTTTCCKQTVCTECVVQINTKEKSTCGCPYCSAKELNVTFVPETPKKASAGTTGSRSRTSTGDSQDPPASSAPNLSYITPDQERKLRSFSVDGNGSGSGEKGDIYIPQCSKTDRETLEQQIREQRLLFDERDIEEHSTNARRSVQTYRNNRLRNSSPFVYSASHSSVSSSRSRLSTGSNSRSATEEGEGRSTNGTTAAATSERMADYSSALENLLFANGNQRISSIQQLEELMLLEAIRLSMQDVPVEQENKSTHHKPEEGSSSERNGPDQDAESVVNSNIMDHSNESYGMSTVSSLANGSSAVAVPEISSDEARGPEATTSPNDYENPTSLRYINGDRPVKNEDDSGEEEEELQEEEDDDGENENEEEMVQFAIALSLASGPASASPPPPSYCT